MATGRPIPSGPKDGPLEAIILAGGAGARFGGGKLTAPWRGGRLIDGALYAAFQAPARSVTLVTGADREVGPAALRFAREAGQADRLRIVHAADHAEGMAATLRTGLAALPADTRGVFVFLGDMPRIPPEVLGPLADRLAEGALAAAPFVGGRRGHPVLFAAALLPSLARLGGDEGAREVLRALGDRLARVETLDEGVLFDVDTREALE
jgi:molybdenum cofactor cytidylyltransferase